MAPEACVGTEEKVASLFEPDTLLPAQYFEIYRRTLYLDPEKKLMLAVLEEAVSCFQKYVFARNRRGKRLFLEAEAWILEEDSDWVFSFENICEALGLSPQCIRGGLLRWKKMKPVDPSKAKIYPLHPKLMRNKPRLTVSRPKGYKLEKVAGR